jgi:uncharacterized protein (TIGR01777 family)
MRVFVTGATGFIGRALSAALVARGDTVVALSRSGAAPGGEDGRPLEGVRAVPGDPTAEGPWRAELAGCDAVVHLAGEPIAAHRWGAEHKEELRRSRVESGRQLAAAIAALPAAERPRVLVTASGADIYPFDSSERPYAEDAPAGHGFLSELCVAWEAATAGAAERVVAMRTGLVLGKGEGALAKLTTPFKLFLGGPVGSGQQWLSWIHLDDVVGGYLLALDRDLRGPINLVTASVRQREFAAALGDALKRPSWLPVPGLALRAAVGELAEHLIHGRRIEPAALGHAGYRWTRPDLAEALAASV